jgi:hypothetical protein
MWWRCTDGCLAPSPSLGEFGTLLDRYAHTIEELDAWSHESHRVDELNAAVNDARTALDARLAALVAEREALAKAGERMIAMYAQLANSGDAGFWDPEEVDEVIALRAAIRAAAHPPEGSHGR